MKNHRGRKKAYLVLQTVLCVLIAAGLVAAAWQIYGSGSLLRAGNPLEWIYTRARVGEKLALLTPLIFAGLGMGIAGMILGVMDERESKPGKKARATGSSAFESGTKTGKCLQKNSGDNMPERDSSLMPETGNSLGQEMDSSLMPGTDSSFMPGTGRRGLRVVRAVLVSAAFVLILVGIANGSATDVLYKAANICTECIGLG